MNFQNKQEKLLSVELLGGCIQEFGQGSLNEEAGKDFGHTYCESCGMETWFESAVYSTFSERIRLSVCSKCAAFRIVLREKKGKVKELKAK